MRREGGSEGQKAPGWRTAGAEAQGANTEYRRRTLEQRAWSKEGKKGRVGFRLPRTRKCSALCLRAEPRGTCTRSIFPTVPCTLATRTHLAADMMPASRYGYGITVTWDMQLDNKN